MGVFGADLFGRRVSQRVGACLEDPSETAREASQDPDQRARRARDDTQDLSAHRVRVGDLGQGSGPLLSFLAR